MRLIDADELKKALAEMWYENNIRITGLSVAELIDEAPTIVPSADTKSCGASADQSADQNVADVPSGETISRSDAIEAVMAEGRNVHASEYANAERIIHEADAVEALAMLPSADRPTENFCRDCPIYSADRPSNVLQEKKPTPIEDYMIGKSRSADRPNYNLETIADIVKQLGHLDGCIADILDRQKVNSTEWVAEKENEFEELNRPQVNPNSAEEQIAETCDRPKGEWEVHEDIDGEYGICSVCGEDADFSHYGRAYNFCPNCGADMRSEFNE